MMRKKIELIGERLSFFAFSLVLVTNVYSQDIQPLLPIEKGLIKKIETFGHGRSNVVRFFPDEKNVLAFTRERELIKINRVTKSFEIVKLDLPKTFLAKYVFRDGKDNFYLVNESSSEIYKLSGITTTLLYKSKFSIQQLEVGIGSFFLIQNDNPNKVIRITFDGLSSEVQIPKHFDYNTQISYIHVDNYDKLWINAYSGYYTWTKKTGLSPYNKHLFSDIHFFYYNEENELCVLEKLFDKYRTHIFKNDHWEIIDCEYEYISCIKKPFIFPEKSLYRYNKGNFTITDKKIEPIDLPIDLPDKHIMDFIILKNEFWISFKNGTTFVIKDGTYKNLNFSGLRNLPPQEIVDFSLDNKGILHILLDNNEVYKMTPNGMQFVIKSDFSKTKRILIDSKNQIWVTGNDKRAISYKENINGTYDTFEVSTNSYFVSIIYESKTDSSIWLGTYQNIFKVRNGEKSTILSEEPNMKTSRCEDIYDDGKGNYYFSYGYKDKDRIWHYNDSIGLNLFYESEKRTLGQLNIDEDGRLISIFGDKVDFIKDGMMNSSKFKIKNVSIENAWFSFLGRVTDIKKDQKERLWISTSQGPVLMKNSKLKHFGDYREVFTGCKNDLILFNNKIYVLSKHSNKFLIIELND